jgi:hypothetical protein
VYRDKRKVEKLPRVGENFKRGGASEPGQPRCEKCTGNLQNSWILHYTLVNSRLLEADSQYLEWIRTTKTMIHIHTFNILRLFHLASQSNTAPTILLRYEAS